MKRVMKWLAVVVAVLVVAVGSVMYTAFGHNRPIVDGQELVPGVRTVKDGFVSVVFLDVGGGNVALVDAGNDKQGKAILAELERRGARPSSVVAIFLTHGHGDHTAACKLFPDAQIYAMESEVERIGDAAHVGHPLKDGNVVRVGDLVVDVFATPGHTAGSAVYFTRGVLFFGDSAGGDKDGSVRAAVGLFSKDPDVNVASLKSLAHRLESRAPEVKVLAFAHSGPLDGLAPLTAFAASH